MISHVQQNIGIFISVMPGARMFKMVTMMLIAFTFSRAGLKMLA